MTGDWFCGARVVAGEEEGKKGKKKQSKKAKKFEV
jgi:hypothetical protein